MRYLGQKRDPIRVALPATDGGDEAYVLFAPITQAMRRRAQRAAQRRMGEGVTADTADIDVLFDAIEEAATELIRLGAIEWGGIVDEGGTAVPLTPDRETRFRTANDPERPTGSIDLLLADEESLVLLDSGYVRPEAERRAEKNASSVSPSGTGEAGTPANAIAGSAAARKAKTAAAKPVRTARMRRKPKPAKGSGRS